MGSKAHSQQISKSGRFSVPIHVVYFLGRRLQSRPNKACLKCPSVRAYVRTYFYPCTKSFFDFNEIWHMGRGRCVMHDRMQYDLVSIDDLC